MDVDDVDAHPGPNTTNEREKINPFSSRSRNNFNSGIDNSGYGMRESPAVIVNSNLLPFIQKLNDPMRKNIYTFSEFSHILITFSQFNWFGSIF